MTQTSHTSASIEAIDRMSEELTVWRRDFHAHPELAFREERTAAIVADRLAGWGIEVHRGIGVTGVVGVLRNGEGPSIGLRADMDALPMQEENDLPYRSTIDGVFHGCGHDGHTTMLLGAAQYLAETRNFAGTVHFIFQPAEEGGGGGKVMIEDGLFDRFDCEEVYALHNWPGMDAGTIGIASGPVMAATSEFTITITGVGGHAALPHATVDPIVVAANLVTALQSIVSRSTAPIDSAVLSVTTLHAGTAFNVIPETATLTGTVRTFRSKVEDRIIASMEQMVHAIAGAHGATGDLDYDRGYPATVNHEAQSDVVRSVATGLVGDERVKTPLPTMGGEDFAYMLEARPGAYFFLGQRGGPSDRMVHHPQYDFNDAVLPIGASMFARLVETQLAS